MVSLQVSPHRVIQLSDDLGPRRKVAAVTLLDLGPVGVNHRARWSS